jgi:hypothetical protein
MEQANPVRSRAIMSFRMVTFLAQKECRWVKEVPVRKS